MICLWFFNVHLCNCSHISSICNWAGPQVFLLQHGKHLTTSCIFYAFLLQCFFFLIVVDFVVVAAAAAGCCTSNNALGLNTQLHKCLSEICVCLGYCLFVVALMSQKFWLSRNIYIYVYIFRYMSRKPQSEQCPSVHKRHRHTHVPQSQWKILYNKK